MSALSALWTERRYACGGCHSNDSEVSTDIPAGFSRASAFLLGLGYADAPNMKLRFIGLEKNYNQVFPRHSKPSCYDIKPRLEAGLSKCALLIGIGISHEGSSTELCGSDFPGRENGGLPGVLINRAIPPVSLNYNTSDGLWFE